MELMKYLLFIIFIMAGLSVCFYLLFILLCKLFMGLDEILGEMIKKKY